MTFLFCLTLILFPLAQVSLFALCRFMAPSYQLCERYLPLLVTALEREQRAELRTSALIALGDLAFRFPNALEPWTSYMYSRCRNNAPPCVCVSTCLSASQFVGLSAVLLF